MQHTANKTSEKVVFFAYKDDKTSFTSDLGNEAIYRFPDKIILIAREKNDEMKCSLRSSKIILPPLVEKALAGLDGYGGGHENACGLNIKTADFWEFGLVSQIDGWRLLYHDNPIKVVDMGMNALDGIYKSFQNKVWAERELKEKGVVFETKWGKGIGVETSNDDVVHLAQKMGYMVAIRKDPKKGYLRVKSFPKPEIDLEMVYNRLKLEEPGATWFLHASHHMVLNGSSKNPDMRPTQKTLQQVIDLVVDVCK